MAIVTTNDQHYHDIANAIREKNGSDTQYTPAEMAAAIQAISGGGGGSEPEPPDDGKTRLYIHVPENAMPGLPPPRADVSLYISQTVSRGVSIDWGDDSPAETIRGTGNVRTKRHYNAGGDYTIALTVAEGCKLGLGWEYDPYDNYCVMGSTGDANRVYCNMLQKAVISDGVTSIGNFAFYQCYSLASVVIPDGVTSIGGYAFRYCDSLASVVIPDDVTSMGAYAFGYCYGVKEYHILATTPPEIQSNTFSGIPSDCIIYVPVGTVDTYKTATNWAELADRIQEEPA